MDVLVEKYGPPMSTAERQANVEEDNELNFEIPNGQLIVQDSTGWLKKRLS